jgi:hypothetical protein
MSTPIDISSWQWPELVRASKLIQKVITNQVSSMFENEFDYDSMKIEYNQETDSVYLSDKNNMIGMVYDNIVYLVDANGSKIDGQDVVVEESSQVQEQFQE